MSDHSRFDWTGFFVQFVCGAVIGAILGFVLWAQSPEEHFFAGAPGVFTIGGAALVLGLAAGFLGDRFWDRIGDWFRGL
jgi:hypothetical protein